MTDIQIDKKIVLNNAAGENLEPYITTDSALSTESDNPIQNSAVTTELNGCLRYDVQGTSQGSSVIVTAHSGLTNLDYTSSGHTGFMSSANFIPAGTVINVELDGTGQFTTIEAAIAYLTGKWSNGQVTIEIGTGTYNISQCILIDTLLFNFVNLKIVGKGIDSTIINAPINSGAFQVIHSGCRVLLSNLSVNGTSKTNSMWLVYSQDFTDFHITDIKVTNSYYGIFCGWDSHVFLGGTSEISDCHTGIECQNGSLLWSDTADLTFKNLSQGINIIRHSEIRFMATTLHWSSVTTKSNISANGWKPEGYIYTDSGTL